MPNKLAALIVVAACCALASCGSGSKGHNVGETTTTLPSDSSRAAKLPLRTSDLPAGFAAVDIRSVTLTPMVSQCVPALLTANATQIGETFVRDRDEVSSQSYVLDSTDAAREVLTTLADSEAQACLATMLQTRFDAAVAAVGLQDVPSSATASGLDPTTAQYRVVAVRTTASTTQTVATGDLLITQSDRSVSAVWLTWIDGSPETTIEKSLVTALRARATAAFSE